MRMGQWFNAHGSNISISRFGLGINVREASLIDLRRNAPW